MNAIIEATGLGYVYPSPATRALEGVEFSVSPGQFVAIMGPNGSGKTTLVKLMIGMLSPTEGQLLVRGLHPSEAPDEVRRAIGYVPQHGSVNSRVPVKVGDVVGLAAMCRARQSGAQVTAAQIHRRAQAALAMVDLGERWDRAFGALSCGQQQRVLVAHALSVDPAILVLDEPFAGVDAASQDTTIDLLQRLSVEKQITILAVVHNINPLVHFVNAVLLLSTRMVAFGNPPEVLTADLLEEAYGRAVPILVCPEGFLHPITESTHSHG